MINPPDKILFLPGASGNTQFWQPVCERLSITAQKFHVGWPGFGDVPPIRSVVRNCMDLTTHLHCH